MAALEATRGDELPATLSGCDNQVTVALYPGGTAVAMVVAGTDLAWAGIDFQSANPAVAVFGPSFLGIFTDRLAALILDQFAAAVEADLAGLPAWVPWRDRGPPAPEPGGGPPALLSSTAADGVRGAGARRPGQGGPPRGPAGRRAGLRRGETDSTGLTA